MRSFLPILTLLALATQTQGQETSNVLANIYRQLHFFPQEKVYLMTDRATYVAGEHIWFRAFLTDAIEHRLDIPKSRYIYVDLIAPDGAILKHHQIRPDSSGVFHNRIELDNDMAQGTYMIRAYTTYMLATPDYLFEKKVFIAHPQSLAKAEENNLPVPRNATMFDVSFFPEGGYFVDGEISKVGFKALRSDGLSEDISGEVFDSDNRLITCFENFHAGMGFFYISVEPDKSYYALCTNREGATLRFDFPTVQSDACAVQVIQRNDQFLITTKDNRTNGGDGLFLIAHIRGLVLYADKMPSNNMVALQASELPAGIIQVLLLDAEMNPLSERLVFNRPHDFAQVEITTDRSEYGKRELVKMDILLNQPSGSFAVSVTDDRDMLPDSTTTIASYLLLSSELKGHIEDAGYYLSNEPAAADALDALMLTQGWRRYNIPAVAKGIMEEPDSYIEGGQEFSGSVKEVLTGRAVQGGSVWAIAPDVEFMKEVKTDKSGLFYISGFEFPDSTRYVVHAHSPMNRRVELVLDTEPQVLPAKAVAARQKEANNRFTTYIAKADRKYIDEQGMRTYELQSAVVTAKKPEEGRSIYSSEISGKTVPQVLIERYQYDIVNILKQTPDLEVIEVNHEITIYVRPRILHNGPAVIVFDDNVLNELRVDDLMGIPIKRIEILKAPNSYIFGLKGGGGAVLITGDWRGESVRKPTPHIAAVTPLGYKQAVEFYAPKYETAAQRSVPNPDLRTTIFWKPDLQIVGGTAHIEFYTADAPNTTYSVVLEGITTDGVVVRQTGRICH